MYKQQDKGLRTAFQSIGNVQKPHRTELPNVIGTAASLAPICSELRNIQLRPWHPSRKKAGERWVCRVCVTDVNTAYWIRGPRASQSIRMIQRLRLDGNFVDNISDFPEVITGLNIPEEQLSPESFAGYYWLHLASPAAHPTQESGLLAISTRARGAQR